MQVNRVMAVSVAVWILSIAVWVYSFYLDFTQHSLIASRGSFELLLLLRLGAVLTGCVSFLVACASLIKNRNLSKKMLNLTQLMSILSSAFCLISAYIYKGNFGSLTELFGVLALCTFFISSIIVFQLKKQFVVFILNSILISPLLVAFLSVLFLAGIGFGSPS